MKGRKFMIFKREKNTWKVYKDKLGDKDLLVRVDTKMRKKKFLHTFYVAIPYMYNNKKSLPNEEELKKVNIIEDLIDNKIKNQNEEIIFVGCANFGGCSYLTYVSNKKIAWEKSIDIDGFDMMLGVYENDNMG